MNSDIDPSSASTAAAAMVSAELYEYIDTIFAATAGDPLMDQLKDRLRAYRVEQARAAPTGTVATRSNPRQRAPISRATSHARSEPVEISVEMLRVRFKTLPAFPKAVQKVLDLLQRPNAQITQVARAVEADTALIMRILRTANSPFYGSRGRVSTLRDACRVLGLHVVRNIAMATLALQQFPLAGASALSRRDLWLHGAAVGAAARVLARRLGRDGETAFTAGLLHDIGRLALDACFPQVYPEALRRRADEGILLQEAERQVFGLDHQAVGAELTRAWQLPEVITDAVAGHHPGDNSTHGEFADLVHVADVLCKILEWGDSGEFRVDALNPLAMGRLSLSVQQLGEWLPEIDAQVEVELKEFESSVA